MNFTITMILLAVAFVPPVMAVERTWKEQVERLKERQVKRFKGYFRHLERERKFEEKRRQGISKHHKKEARREKARELARRAHIIERQKKKDVPPWLQPGAYARYLQKKAQEKRQRAKQRDRFKARRNYVEEQLQSSDQVLDPQLEYGL